MKPKKVSVLMGGWSSEREVSLISGQAVAQTLSELGHHVQLIDVKKDVFSLLKALDPKPDVVFNALHGVGGEDGVIQGILEMLSIPYTHSGVTASALAMNKVLSRKIFESIGIRVPDWKVIGKKELSESDPFTPPYVIKPINEGSSKGVAIIHHSNERPQLNGTWPYGDEILVEKYIKGREIQVGVMGGKALGAIEIRPLCEFYDYKAKYTPGYAEHIIPVVLSSSSYEKVLELAETSHNILGCKGVSRVDFLYEEDEDNFYLLEVNTQPGMTPLSLLSEIAGYQGISFQQLVDWMVQNAQCDH